MSEDERTDKVDALIIDTLLTLKFNAASVRAGLARAFTEAVGGCNIQDGWPCRTCFWDTFNRLGLPSEEIHALWLIQLRLRGDDSRQRFTIKVLDE